MSEIRARIGPAIRPSKNFKSLCDMLPINCLPGRDVFNTWTLPLSGRIPEQRHLAYDHLHWQKIYESPQQLRNSIDKEQGKDIQRNHFEPKRETNLNNNVVLFAKEDYLAKRLFYDLFD